MLKKERQAKIDTKALEEFVQPNNIENFKGLTQEEIQHIFNENKKEVADRQEFAPPPEKTNFEKVKSVVKAGVGYFVESQFGVWGFKRNIR
ncbi:hypothetical protein [Rickettsia tamurae]|uniref:hypothetical protein n=1 Tax=Rickettsia tamurae TaxID=334545 RepID=UPI000AE044B3|nr:hypothetical protein [Rickettsia tamurae]